MKRLFTTRNLIILAAIVALFVVSRLLGLTVAKPEVSIAAEPIFYIGSFAVTNALLTTWIVMIIWIILALLATRRIPRNLSQASNEELVPSGFQNVMEAIIEYAYRLVREMSGRWTSKFFPIVMTIFLMVIVSNWIGLVPGLGSIGILQPPGEHTAPSQLQATEAAAGNTGHQTGPAAALTAESLQAEAKYIPLLRAPSTDLNLTIALALVSVCLTQYFGVRALRGSYFHRFFDGSGFKNGALVGVATAFGGILELIGEFVKIISFSFRLFGNVFAGEVLLGVMAFLIPYIASLPFFGLELFVGFIQAVVFMMLTLVFFVNATIGHGGEAATGHPVAEQH